MELVSKKLMLKYISSISANIILKLLDEELLINIRLLIGTKSVFEATNYLIITTRKKIYFSFL